ncbi:carbohydrate sulfotransferase 12-like [Eriocheir sinensis]|uniref:carbohydrate sulfotransferase 12-like n=1 Tax=Eriocheir sinensis TaxID=95602 RepID=UPI0021C73B24|nr:carbohydrate sulfotransferase 12-like [Eriocheir sinensis]
MQPAQHWLNSTKDTPLLTGLPLGARTAPRNDCSSNPSRLQVTQGHHDLEEEFRRRHKVLLCECMHVSLPKVTLRPFYKHVLPGPLTMCRILKQVASKALQELVHQMEDKVLATPWPASAVIVRHPLARLASAYRDKFLNGKQLNKYNDEYRNITQSLDGWETRFIKYWLPALASEGLLERNREFNETLNKIRKAYQVYVNNYVSQTGVLLGKPSQTEEKKYGREEMEIAYNMLFVGPHFGLARAFMNSYNLSDLAQQFRDTSFTFNQFLRHVVWTHDVGMPNEHWTTYTDTCDPCRMKFDYILRLETVQEEMQHLFSGVLGFLDEVSFPVKHRSYGHVLAQSDREYYANVSSELMDRLLDIYKHDFAIFGYTQDL